MSIRPVKARPIICFMACAAACLVYRALYPLGMKSETTTFADEKRIYPPSSELVDPLLVKSSLSPDGFQLRPGEWEFPGFGWSLSSRVTSEPPMAALGSFADLADSDFDAEDLSARNLDGQDSRLDEQLLSLIRTMMTPTDSGGSRLIHEKSSAGLRGAAVCRRVGEHEVPEIVCLQWPANGDLWTEVSLRRRAVVAAIRPIVALPAGSEVVSQRRGADETIQFQAAEVPASPDRLRRFFVENGFRIETVPGPENCFHVVSDSGVFEFTCRVLDIDRTSVLLRQLPADGSR